MSVKFLEQFFVRTIQLLFKSNQCNVLRIIWDFVSAVTNIGLRCGGNLFRKSISVTTILKLCCYICIIVFGRAPISSIMIDGLYLNLNYYLFTKLSFFVWAFLCNWGVLTFLSSNSQVVVLKLLTLYLVVFSFVTETDRVFLVILVGYFVCKVQLLSLPVKMLLLNLDSIFFLFSFSALF